MTLPVAMLPTELVESIAQHLPLPDLVNANAVSRVFRGAPGTHSPVERALLERARARGHARALAAAAPRDDGSTTTGELLAHERVHALARAHSHAVACGTSVLHQLSMSAFVDADGALYTWGEEKALDDSDDGEDEEAAACAYRACAGLGHAETSSVLVPRRVASLSAVHMCAVAAGYDHLLALSASGEVYACGENREGQLGLGDTATRRVFVQVMALAHEVVVCVAGGSRCSLALSTAGRAYSWGQNNHGQLGHGDTVGRLEPTRIEALGDERVAGACAGMFHVQLVTVGGAVYSCGRGQAGQLGHGDQQDQHTPRRIEALAGVRAVHVSAGVAHSLVVDAAGGVHSFGQGRSGCLGHGDESAVSTPTRIEALAGVRAVRASAGSDSSVVLSADGSLHAFGSNRCSQLGAKTRHTRVPHPTPVHVVAHARVSDCALGHSHALFMTVDGDVYSCGQQTAALGHGVSADADGTDVATPSPCIARRSVPRAPEGTPAGAAAERWAVPSC